MEAKHSSGRGHEMTDASISGLVKFSIGLFVLIVVVLFAMRSMFEHFSTTQQLGPPASPFAETQTLPPSPRLQVEPALDLKQLRQGEDEKLNSYGWVDQKAGIARIPIDRAMDLLLAKGLPVRGENPPKQAKK
jgi:hypothetical protein